MARSKPTPRWLVWGIVASGLSALFFWKQAHPGESLNPMKGSPDAER